MPRKQYKYHYIYRTVNLITGRFYIGMHSTNNLEDDYLGSGRRLKYSINKYGEKVHNKVILEFCENRKELKKREREIVNETLLKNKMCMNMTVGGDGGPTRIGMKHTQETKEKIRNSLIGHKVSDETKLKISISERGKGGYKLPPMTLEHRQKLSNSHKGKTSPRKGVKLSKKQKLKISLSLKKYFNEKM